MALKMVNILGWYTHFSIQDSLQTVLQVGTCWDHIHVKLMNFQVGMFFFPPPVRLFWETLIYHRVLEVTNIVDLAVCLEVGYPISYGIINSTIKITRTLGSISKKEIVG